MRYPQPYVDYIVRFPVFVGVYHVDGTVAVSSGGTFQLIIIKCIILIKIFFLISGIEMGQGINTKVVQCVAKTLNIPMSKVQVKPNNNLISPNSCQTGGSVSSELVCLVILDK